MKYVPSSTVSRSYSISLRAAACTALDEASEYLLMNAVLIILLALPSDAIA